MDVTLRLLTTLDDALDLAEDLDRYAAQAVAEFRDDVPPAGTGERILRRVIDSREGVILTAHDKREGHRIGMCITGPLLDPLVGDATPMVLVLHVHPDLRHRGLARKMVDAVSVELARRGHTTLAARAGHNDDALISMGERWGFVRSYEMMVREGQ